MAREDLILIAVLAAAFLLAAVDLARLDPGAEQAAARESALVVHRSP